ncbi:hypothetical protein Z949_3830 [Sulfitobacter guttiformis KCTC 32187]|nr:hypothetical protein Z949_3830 [Sulfitobacter guttiformis KCTC 32187]
MNLAALLSFLRIALNCSSISIEKGLLPVTSIFMILMLLLNILWFFIIAHVVMSWLINFQVLNTRQPLVAQIWYGINRLLEPIYGPIRRVLPNMGGLDLAPLAVLIAVAVARIVLTNNAALFY